MRRSRWLAAALLALYFVVMFPLLDRLERSWEYGSYVFEATFVAWVWIVYRPRLSFRLWRGNILDVLLMLAGGFAIFKLARALSLPIPFDLRSPELLLFLLLIGPVIEELVFRGALWELLAIFGTSGDRAQAAGLVILTSVIFSFAHFFAWWSVPPELHGFVIYQALYTLALGVYLGARRAKSESIAVPLLAHASFNLGFYLAYLR